MLVDDQLLQIKALERKLNHVTHINIVGTSTDGLQALSLVEEVSPDIIVMDIKMPKFSGLEAARHIKSIYPNIKIIMLSGSVVEDDIRDAIEIGVEGYLMKDTQENELIEAIEVVYNNGRYIPSSIMQLINRDTSVFESHWSHGKRLLINNKHVYLTQKELNMMKLVVLGNSYRHIAIVYNSTEDQVKTAIHAIIEKLELKDHNEIALFAIKHSLFE